MKKLNKTIGVIGSSNIDFVSYLDDFPKVGETIKSNSLEVHFGGKGANQAVAAGRNTKNKVYFYTKYNKKDAGLDMMKSLRSSNINGKFFFESKEKTGSAFILISEAAGDNQIIINKSANIDFRTKDKKPLTEMIDLSDILIFQNEISEEYNEWSIKKAHKAKKEIIINPAPIAGFDKELFKYASFLVVNETELDEIIPGKKGYKNKAKDIMTKYKTKDVIVTLGSEGSYIASIDKKIPSVKAKVVDTTSAGDTFIGVFAAGLSEGKSIEESIKLASVAGSISVTRRGAQSSIPWKHEVEELLGGKHG